MRPSRSRSRRLSPPPYQPRVPGRPRAPAAQLRPARACAPAASCCAPARTRLDDLARAHERVRDGQRRRTPPVALAARCCSVVHSRSCMSRSAVAAARARDIDGRGRSRRPRCGRRSRGRGMDRFDPSVPSIRRAPTSGAPLPRKTPPAARVVRGVPLKKESRRRPIFPGGCPPSIFGAEELNFRVRDGNGWSLSASVTGIRFNCGPAKSVAVAAPMAGSIRFVADLPRAQRRARRVSRSSPRPLVPLRSMHCCDVHVRPIKQVVSLRSYPVTRWGTSS